MKLLRGRGLSVALPLLLVGSLSAVQGCGEQEDAALRSAQVAGAWEGSGGGRIEFDADGTFDMSGIPRSAIVFSFVAPPPGKGRISGTGAWELGGEEESSGVVELRFDAGESFLDDGEFAMLRVDRGGENPELYFDTDPDKAYGYEVRRVGRETAT